MCKEDQLSWLSSADDIGGPQDALKSDAKFSCPNPSQVKTVSENHDLLNGCSSNNCAMSDVPNSYADCSWNSGRTDSFTSFLTGPDIEDSKDGSIPLKQVDICIYYPNSSGSDFKIHITDLIIAGNWMRC